VRLSIESYLYTSAVAYDRPRRRLPGGLPAVQGRYGLIAAIAIDSLGTGLFLPFTVLYFIHTTPLSATAIGTALSVAGFAALPTPVALARLIDRGRPKTIVAAGNLISFGAFAAYLVVGDQIELIAAALAAAIGQATFWTATRALIGHVTVPGERGAWFALQTAIRNAGYGLGGLLGAIAVSMNTPVAFHSLAGLDASSYLLAAIFLLRWKPAATAQTPTAPTAAPPPPRVGYRNVLSDRKLLGVTAINAVFVLCASVLTVLMSVYVVTTLHQPAWLAGLLFTLNTILVVAAQTSLTQRTRLHTAPRVLRGAAIAWIASFTVLWLLGSVPRDLAIAGLIIAIVVFSFAEMLHGPTINVLIVEIAPSHAPGRHLSVFQLSWSIGQALAPAVLLWLLAAGPSWLWTALIALCAATAAGVSRIAPAPPSQPESK
jgi:MFS family permease